MFVLCYKFYWLIMGKNGAIGGVLSNLKANFGLNLIQTLMIGARWLACASFLTSSSPACWTGNTCPSGPWAWAEPASAAAWTGTPTGSPLPEWWAGMTGSARCTSAAVGLLWGRGEKPMETNPPIQKKCAYPPLLLLHPHNRGKESLELSLAHLVRCDLVTFSVLRSTSSSECCTSR